MARTLHSGLRLVTLGLRQPRVRGNFRLRVLRWHGSLSAKANKSSPGLVMTGVSPSFRVGVSFRAISLCLILNQVFYFQSQQTWGPS